MKTDKIYTVIARWPTINELLVNSFTDRGSMLKYAAGFNPGEAEVTAHEANVHHLMASEGFLVMGYKQMDFTAIRLEGIKYVESLKVIKAAELKEGESITK
jgi:hypothetical protein